MKSFFILSYALILLGSKFCKFLDIDIFIDDVQYLSALSSRCNDEATEALDYVETGRYISLTFPEGKIDFIASPPLTPFAHKEAIFLGQHILWEHPSRRKTTRGRRKRKVSRSR